MPGTMTEHENNLSLLSIEVLISQVHIGLNIECHLPCIVFRLLDYPAVTIPYFDQWQLEEFHDLKKAYPTISWRQLLSDQFYELRSANGKFNFKRGKSCLFKTYFKTLYTHLLNVPLFILLIDQINDSKTTNTNTTQFIGSCNIKLNELIEVLNQTIIKNGSDTPLVEQQTFHCTLFNLMGTQIGTCDIAVRFCHYGTTIVTQLPMLDDGLLTKTEKKVPMVPKQQKTESLAPPQAAPIDTIVKHIHFVNEKKDVGLQLSRSDLPSSSSNNKSAQTRWTSTKSRPTDYHQSKGRYLRAIEDPSIDDPTIASYRPPPLYFNSDSDFLQMTTTPKVANEAKENRLSYLASIPIDSFDDTMSNDENEKQQPKRKSATNVRFNLPSPSIVSQTKINPKQHTLTKDFLHNFPLLRSLVEEALALQQYQSERPNMSNERPHSAIQQRQINFKQNSTRPKSATNIHSIRAKSVIVTRNINNTRRLYPPPPKTRQMLVAKHEVRDLVDRLSKPKFNKRLEREIASIDQDTTSQASPPLKPTSIPSTSSGQKPSPSYGTTRAHRLLAEYSRARRAALEPQAISSPKPQTSPRKEPIPTDRILSSPPRIINTAPVSRLSLLNKVDVDTVSAEKNSIPRRSIETTPENAGRNIKSSSKTSQDVTLKLNQTITKSVSSTPEPTAFRRDQENDERKDDLTFSITDITDYFTDGDESSTRPPTRQST